MTFLYNSWFWLMLKCVISGLTWLGKKKKEQNEIKQNKETKWEEMKQRKETEV